VVVQLLRVAQEEVDRQEHEHEGRQHQIGPRQPPAGEQAACLNDGPPLLTYVAGAMSMDLSATHSKKEGSDGQWCMSGKPDVHPHS
jgi:hypothetical protein